MPPSSIDLYQSSFVGWSLLSNELVCSEFTSFDAIKSEHLVCSVASGRTCSQRFVAAVSEYGTSREQNHVVGIWLSDAAVTYKQSCRR